MPWDSTGKALSGKTRKCYTFHSRAGINPKEKYMKIKLVTMLFCLQLPFLFADDLRIAEDYVRETGFIQNYKILDPEITFGDGNVYVFYVPYNIDRTVKKESDGLPLYDALVVIVSDGKAKEYLRIQRNGRVATKDAALSDFSLPGYSHVRFNGWLFDIAQRGPGFSINLQLTTDGIDAIPADSLSSIVWEPRYGYPVKYQYTGYMVSPAIVAESGEDEKIILARSGLDEYADIAFLEDFYIKKITEKDKRTIINAMFALNGYRFRTKEWLDYFSRYFWYKPDETVKNTVDILNENQKRLYQYLSNVKEK
jgi:hypothetical protein